MSNIRPSFGIFKLLFHIMSEYLTESLAEDALCIEWWRFYRVFSRRCVMYRVMNTKDDTENAHYFSKNTMQSILPMQSPLFSSHSYSKDTFSCPVYIDWLTTYFAMFGVFQHSAGILMGTNSAHLLAVWGIDYFMQTCSLNIDRHTSHPTLNNNKVYSNI